MNISIIKETIQQSLAGTATFPQIVGKLIAMGVESYHVDLVRTENRYYLPNGESHVEPVAFSHSQAAPEFNVLEIQAAIKASQAGQIKYQEFLNRIMAAGTVYYITYLAGKKVIYFGREGDFHVEHFPNRS